MKKFLFLLAFTPATAMALCLNFYFDKDGQTHSVQCGSNLPELKCHNNTYWNGRSCVPVPIIKKCEAQGGKWEQVQLRGANLSDAFESGKLVQKRAMIHMCVCPNKKVWDGKTCRSNVPTKRQCTNFFGDGTNRMTEEFFGSKDCPRIPKD